ncbi:LytTR family DNA-binding domain-containing protein [Sphingomonas swuensis]|uniref:LytTR family DNA-binding domain-containing protein n=1 Tax=Sphingomonas swuensis TaxID=977800 RepID=A0ABP7T7N8_9SPHN
MNGQGQARQWFRRGLISLALVLLAAVVLAALGPFGSFAEGGFGARLGYWLPAVLVGFAVFRPIVWLGEWAARTLELPRMAAIGGAVLVGAVPATLAIGWLGGGLRDGLPPLDALAPLYFNVALVGALITLLFVSLERKVETDRPPDGTASQPPSPPSPFLDRLPADWGGELHALEMEDHYVRAHGPDGRSLLILMRMADAERELAGTDGLRVHRSWWVARRAVEGRERDGRRLVLRLKGGLEAPVARDRAGALRDAGWI